MNKEKVAILVDSGCDIPKEQIEEYGIKVMPLRVMYPEGDYRDGENIDPLMVYKRFPDEIPTTSTPTLQEVKDKFEEIKREGYEKVIAVCISSGLSGTYNTVRLAAEAEKDMECFVFDTKNISFGSGIFAVWAAEKLNEGKDFAWITETMQKKVYDAKIFYYMDTLKYLQKGGRIGLVTSTVGSLLKLKPIISCNQDGVYYTVAKIRGSKLAKKKLLGEVTKACEGNDVWLVIGHGDASEEADKMEAMIDETVKKKRVVFKKQITASMAVHTGPGLVGVLVFQNP